MENKSNQALTIHETSTTQALKWEKSIWQQFDKIIS